MVRIEGLPIGRFNRARVGQHAIVGGRLRDVVAGVRLGHVGEFRQIGAGADPALRDDLAEKSGRIADDLGRVFGIAVALAGEILPHRRRAAVFQSLLRLLYLLRGELKRH